MKRKIYVASSWRNVLPRGGGQVEGGRTRGVRLPQPAIWRPWIQVEQRER